MNPSQPQRTKCQTCLGILGCFGGLFVQLIVGSVYQWGIINIYVTSYMRNVQSQDITLQDNAIAFPCMFFAIGLTMRLGLFLSEITHPLIVMAINEVICAAAIFACSYVESFGAFVALYGIVFGLVSGLNFMIPIVECNKYFPGKKMYVNGVILIGTGLGSVVFGLFSYNFLNPNKLPPLEGYYDGPDSLQEIANRVPECLRWLSLLYLVIGLLGVLMLIPVTIHNRKKQKQKQREKEEKENEEQAVKRPETQTKIRMENQNQENKEVKEEQINETIEEKIEERGYAETLKEAFCSAVCWLKVAIILFGSCGVFLINGNYKTYVKQEIDDDEFLTLIGVVGAIGNGCTRFFWNLLFSRTGYKTVILLNLSINIVVFSVIRFTVTIPELYLFMVFLINSCIGGFLVMTPTFAQIVFGQETGSNIYGFYWDCFAVANFISYAYVSRLTQHITFDGVIYICLGMCVVAVPLVIFGNFEGPWKNSTQSLNYCICCKKQEEEQKRDEKNNVEENEEENKNK